MKTLKKLVASLAVLATLSTSAVVEAQPYVYESGGYGYEEARRAPALAPTIALSTIAAAAIIAVILQNGGGSSHGHSHS